MAAIKNIDGKDYIYCFWRHRYVRLTPEEWVRQRFLERLVSQYHYPQGLIAVEVGLKRKRTDALVYSRTHEPLVLLEFKADDVPISQDTLDQISVYNQQIKVPYWMMSNGRQTVVAHLANEKITFLNDIPQWEEIC